MMNRIAAPLFASLLLPLAACSLDAQDVEDERADDAITTVGETTMDPNALRGFGSTLSSGTGTARCYELTCPGDIGNTCYIPCVTAGGTVKKCADACGCTAKEISCSTGTVTM